MRLPWQVNAGAAVFCAGMGMADGLTHTWWGVPLMAAGAGVNGTVAVIARRRQQKLRVASRKPDYVHIGLLEQEIFGRTYTHDGAPVTVRPAPAPPRPPRPATPPLPPPPSGYSRTVTSSGMSVNIQAGRDISISIGGTVSAGVWDSGWSAAIQSAAAAQIQVPDELKALVNWPRCPGCGKFSQGSTGRPSLCVSCRERPTPSS